MKRILWGLLVAVAPGLAAGFGVLMANLYGRSVFTDLIQWSLLALIISIPLGAALVVSGSVLKIAQDRARREAGIADAVRKRDWLPHLLLGAFLVAAPAYLGLVIGKQHFTPAEAWQAGASQFYVACGVVLIVLALFIRAGSAVWQRWPIALWGPLFAIGNQLWQYQLGLDSFNVAEFGVGVLIAAAWMWLHLRRI